MTICRKCGKSTRDPLGIVCEHCNNEKKYLKEVKGKYEQYDSKILHINPKLFKNALEEFGLNAQIDMLIEEMSELTQALCKFKRGKSHNIEEEIADVEIVLNQIKLAFDKVELAKWLNFKTHDLEILLDDLKRKREEK